MLPLVMTGPVPVRTSIGAATGDRDRPGHDVECGAIGPPRSLPRCPPMTSAHGSLSGLPASRRLAPAGRLRRPAGAVPRQPRRNRQASGQAADAAACRPAAARRPAGRRARPGFRQLARRRPAGAGGAGVRRTVRPNDWQLVTRAEQRGGTWCRCSRVLNPKGEDKGNTEGLPVPTAAWATAARDPANRPPSDAAPRIANLLTGINSIAARRPEQPVQPRREGAGPAVTGAPGDGNISLTRQMKTHLVALGTVVQDERRRRRLHRPGRRPVVPIAGGQQRVEIQWSVNAPSGDERGQVVQLNDIPAGSLDHYWADVAVVVATEAAGGVNDVILRASPGGSRASRFMDRRRSASVEGARPGAERPAP